MANNSSSSQFKIDSNTLHTREDSRQEFSGISIDLSSSTSTIACRICQDSKNLSEPLISPCRCSGSMGLIHKTCLEKWLGHSGSNRCEVCQFEFKTERTSKPFRQWLHEGGHSRDRRYFLIDTLCFMLLTPLGCISSWLCIQGAKEYYETTDKWTGFGLIMLSTFLALMYIFWALITFRYHIEAFRKWQRKNQVVRIIFENSTLRETENV